MNNRHRIRALKSAHRVMVRQERTDWSMGFDTLARIRSNEIAEVEAKIVALEAAQPPRKPIRTPDAVSLFLVGLGVVLILVHFLA